MKKTVILLLSILTIAVTLSCNSVSESNPSNPSNPIIYIDNKPETCPRHTAHAVSVDPSCNLQDVIDACENPAIDNQYDIVLSEGVYNIINLQTKDYVNLRGATTDYDKYWIKGERPNGSTECGNYQTIMYNTSTELENLKITCKNMRYPYHNDNCKPYTVQTVNNCWVEHLGNYNVTGIPATIEESGWTSCHANGCGTNSGMLLVITNSVLIARQNGMALYAHDNPTGMTAPSRIIAENNMLIQADGGAAIFMCGSLTKNILELRNNHVIGSYVNYGWVVISDVSDYK